MDFGLRVLGYLVRWNVVRKEETVTGTYEEVEVGDLVQFQDGTDRRWWTTRDRDDRFLVLTADNEKVHYTVVDLTGWQDFRYNGVGYGVVRSPLDTWGNAWPLGRDGEGADTIIPAIRSEEWGLSRRKVVQADNIRTVKRK